MASAASRPNVLLAVFDDLRPQLSVYNNRSFMRTPHVGSFAAEAMVFDRAYTNYA